MPLKLDGTYGVSGVVGTASSAAVYGADADSGIVFSGNQTLINSDGSTIATVGASGINVTGIVTATTVSVGSGTSISSPATNVLTLGINNVESVRIDSSGNLGIGTNNPTKALHISQNSDVAIRMHSGNSNTNARSWEIVVGGNASNNAEMVFRTRNDAGTGGSEAARFTASGNLAFPSGQGIDFSATANSSGTMTSELLDDYEEGTWTPAYRFAGGGSVTYQSQVAVYTKIGRVVYISGRIAVTTISSPSGQAFVSGLPFTPVTYSSQRINGVTIHRAGSWNTAPIAGTIFETNSGEIEFYKASTTANNTTDLLGSDLAANCFVSFFGQYEI